MAFELKCAGCGEYWPCSDSHRKDISGIERARHHIQIKEFTILSPEVRVIQEVMTRLMMGERMTFDERRDLGKKLEGVLSDLMEKED